MVNSTAIELKRTDSICPSPEDLLLEYVQKNEVNKCRNLISDHPELTNHIYGYPYYNPILQICCTHFKEIVHPSIIKLLVDLGADPFFNQEQDNQKQLLHLAAESTRQEILEAVVGCLRKYPDSINAVDANYNTALHVLIKEGEIDSPDFMNCLRILVDNGIDVNKGDSRNMSAILLAAKKGYRNIVTYLLQQRNIDIDTHKDIKGKTARHYIQEKKLADLQLPNELQNNNNNTKDVLFGYLKNNDAASFFNFKGIESLVNADDGNNTVLQLACKNGQTEIVEYLLNKNADPNLATEREPKLPIEIVSERGYYEIFELFSKRADTHIPETVICNLLKHSNSDKLGEIDYEKCYELLQTKLDACNVNFFDNNQNTPLHYAVAYAEPDKTLELLNLGASLASKNRFGIAPVQDISADLLEKHLDHCITTTNKNDNIRENCIVRFDYRTLVPPPKKIDCRTNSDAEKNPLQEMQDYVAETEVVSFISGSKELNHLLKHPVISSFLFLKWHKIRCLFYVNLAFYVTFALSLILYVLFCYSSQNKSDDNSGLRTFLIFVLSVTLTLLVFRELFQVLVSPRTYFFNFENWIELCLIVLTFSILIAGSHSEDTRKQLSAFAVLLTTFELVLLVGQHPLICTNVVMLRTVSYNFFKFLLWFSVLILAFAFSFYVLFNNAPGKKSNATESEDQDFFSDPGMSIIKTIVMLTGEFDASSIDFDTFPLASRLIFLMFVFMIAIILFNLLNGLAVSDTQMIQSDAELVGLIARVDHIRYVESMILGNLLPTSVISLIRTVCCCIPFNPNANISTPKFFAKKVCLFPHFLQNYSLKFYPMKGGEIILEDVSSSIHYDCHQCYKICLDGKTIRRTLSKLEERRIQKDNAMEKEILVCLKDISQKLEQLLNRSANH